MLTRRTDRSEPSAVSLQTALSTGTLISARLTGCPTPRAGKQHPDVPTRLVSVVRPGEMSTVVAQEAIRRGWDRNRKRGPSRCCTQYCGRMPARCLMTVTNVNYIKHSGPPPPPPRGASRQPPGSLQRPHCTGKRAGGHLMRFQPKPRARRLARILPAWVWPRKTRLEAQWSWGLVRARRPHCWGQGTRSRQSQRTRTVLLQGPCAAGTHAQRKDTAVSLHFRPVSRYTPNAPTVT